MRDWTVAEGGGEELRAEPLTRIRREDFRSFEVTEEVAGGCRVRLVSWGPPSASAKKGSDGG